MSEKLGLGLIISSAENKRRCKPIVALPNVLNEFFSSVGQTLAASVPPANHHFSDYLPAVNSPSSFFFEPVTYMELETEILLLPTNKSHGLYSCPVRVLKSSSSVLSLPLAHIMNNSVLTGQYPSKLKHAKIIPIFKGGDETDPSNYRPISLLSLFNRLFEKVMYNRLKSYLELNGLLYNGQYGFRENMSTQHAILDIVNSIQSNMDNKLFTCGIFLDFKKAFDTVDHSILLSKLYHYGIRGPVNEWFSSYLNGRVQTTQIDKRISSKRNVLTGVPQGSVLGPLLFVIYINDIYNSSEKLSFYLFADDTNLLYADKDLKSLESVINIELQKVCDWLNANKLTINAKKSNFVIFRPSQKKLSYQINIRIYNNASNSDTFLECKDYVKFLSVLIDKNLTWKYRIDYIASKISRVVGIISRLRHSVPLNTLIQVYRSLIFPYTHYGIAAWGQAAQVYLKKVFMLQKQALRLMFFADNSSHAIPLFVSANVLPLNMLYFETVCSLMHDISTNSAPQNICDLFTCSSDLHSHNTRFSDAGNLYINKSRLRIQLNSFSIFGAKLWNCLKPDLRKLRKQPFKNKIHQFLLAVLGNEDDYVDVSTLMLKITNYH